MKNIFMQVCKSKEGKRCLIVMAAAAVVALILPFILPGGQITMFIELGISIVILVNSNRFSALISMAQFMNEHPEHNTNNSEQ